MSRIKLGRGGNHGHVFVEIDDIEHPNRKAQCDCGLEAIGVEDNGNTFVVSGRYSKKAHSCPNRRGPSSGEEGAVAAPAAKEAGVPDKTEVYGTPPAPAKPVKLIDNFTPPIATPVTNVMTEMKAAVGSYIKSLVVEPSDREVGEFTNLCLDYSLKPGEEARMYYVGKYIPVVPLVVLLRIVNRPDLFVRDWDISVSKDDRGGDDKFVRGKVTVFRTGGDHGDDYGTISYWLNTHDATNGINPVEVGCKLWVETPLVQLQKVWLSQAIRLAVPELKLPYTVEEMIIHRDAHAHKHRGSGHQGKPRSTQAPGQGGTTGPKPDLVNELEEQFAKSFLGMNRAAMEVVNDLARAINGKKPYVKNENISGQYTGAQHDDLLTCLRHPFIPSFYYDWIDRRTSDGTFTAKDAANTIEYLSWLLNKLTEWSVFLSRQLSAEDVAVVMGALIEIGDEDKSKFAVAEDGGEEAVLKFADDVLSARNAKGDNDE